MNRRPVPITTKAEHVQGLDRRSSTERSEDVESLADGLADQRYTDRATRDRDVHHQRRAAELARIAERRGPRSPARRPHDVAPSVEEPPGEEWLDREAALDAFVTRLADTGAVWGEAPNHSRYATWLSVGPERRRDALAELFDELVRVDVIAFDGELYSSLSIWRSIVDCELQADVGAPLDDMPIGRVARLATVGAVVVVATRAGLRAVAWTKQRSQEVVTLRQLADGDGGQLVSLEEAVRAVDGTGAELAPSTYPTALPRPKRAWRDWCPTVADAATVLSEVLIEHRLVSSPCDRWLLEAVALHREGTARWRWPEHVRDGQLWMERLIKDLVAGRLVRRSQAGRFNASDVAAAVADQTWIGAMRQPELSAYDEATRARTRYAVAVGAIPALESGDGRVWPDAVGAFGVLGSHASRRAATHGS